jgi:hypothetical protein
VAGTRQTSTEASLLRDCGVTADTPTLLPSRASGCSSTSGAASLRSRCTTGQRSAPRSWFSFSSHPHGSQSSSLLESTRNTAAIGKLWACSCPRASRLTRHRSPRLLSPRSSGLASLASSLRRSSSKRRRRSKSKALDETTSLPSKPGRRRLENISALYSAMANR